MEERRARVAACAPAWWRIRANSRSRTPGTSRSPGWCLTRRPRWRARREKPVPPRKEAEAEAEEAEVEEAEAAEEEVGEEAVEAGAEGGGGGGGNWQNDDELSD